MSFFPHSAEIDDLSFIQKLTIILSNVLTCETFSLIIFGVPKLRPTDAFYAKSEFIFIIDIIYSAIVSAIISFLIHFSIYVLIRYGKKELAGQAIFEETKGTYETKAWGFLIGFIYLNICFLIIFGFWVPIVKSLQWAAAVAFAMLTAIVLLETFHKVYKKLTGLAEKLKNLNLRRKLFFIIKDIEIQRKYLHDMFGDYLLRPYLKVKYHPLTYTEYKRKQILLVAREFIAKLFRDFIFFIAFTVSIFYLLLIATDSNMVYGYKAMRDMVVEGAYLRGYELNDITQLKDIYQYLYTTFIPTIHPMHWYGEWYVVDPGLMVDFNTRLLGVARLRQLRVKRRSSCVVPKSMRFLNVTCISDYSFYNDGDFDDEDNANETDQRMVYIWEKKNWKEAGASMTTGLSSNN